MNNFSKSRKLTLKKIIISTASAFATTFFFLWWIAQEHVLFSEINVLRTKAHELGILVAKEAKFGSPQYDISEAGILLTILITIIVLLILFLKQRAEAMKHEAHELAGSMTHELVESREWFRQLYDDSPVPYIMLSPEGKIRQPNKSALRLFGQQADKLCSKHFSDLFADGCVPDARQYLEFFKRKIPIYKKEMQITRYDGAVRWTLLSVFILQNKEQKRHHGLVTLIDITEQKEIEQAKTEFLSLASHQLRTPLATMKWHLEVLLSGDFGEVNDKQGQYLQKIYMGNQRMIELVGTLLNVTRIEMGTLTTHTEKVDITEMSDGVVDELGPQIYSKKLTIAKEYGEENCFIYTDPRFMRIVLQNLLSNAVKYTPDNGHISITIKKDAETVAITVFDNGYGIPTEAHDKIFSKLFRADNAQKIDPKGIGLGLYMTKSIVETLGGTISFDSEIGKGSTFTVSLPAKDST